MDGKIEIQKNKIAKKEIVLNIIFKAVEARYKNRSAESEPLK